MWLIAGGIRTLTEGSCRNELRGYKVTDVNRTRKFGVACRSLQELKRKACSKLNVTNDLAEVNVYLLDGSLIDEEYFHTLKPQTTLILQKPGEKVLSDADLLYDTLRRVNIDFLTAGDKVSQFLTENLKAKVAVLNSALNTDDTKTLLSKRDEHPEWFQTLETNYTTKEAYMHRRCQDRIRGYLYKTIEQIKSSDVYTSDRKARQHLLQIIAFFKLQLKEDHYFGYYFDRSKCHGFHKKSVADVNDDDDETDHSACYEHCPCKLSSLEADAYYRLFDLRAIEQDCRSDVVDARRLAPRKSDASKEEEEGEDRDEEIECPYTIQPDSRKEQVALCDLSGEFRCAGIWNADECSYGGKHRINPYRSREELILFSTWNLDHKIERARSLVPELIRMSTQSSLKEKDVHEYYDNLFTVKNLRLVHIVCHDKGTHK